LVAKDQAQEKLCVLDNNLLHPNFLEKRVASNLQQQHGEQGQVA